MERDGDSRDSHCGDEEETVQETQPAGPVSITFWHSMTAANEDTLKALSLGARGYVKKPFQPSELHALIEQLYPAN